MNKTSNKPQTIQSLCSLTSLQDERYPSCERHTAVQQLDGQDQSQWCILFNSVLEECQKTWASRDRKMYQFICLPSVSYLHQECSLKMSPWVFCTARESAMWGRSASVCSDEKDTVRDCSYSTGNPRSSRIPNLLLKVPPGVLTRSDFSRLWNNKLQEYGAQVLTGQASHDWGGQRHAEKQRLMSVRSLPHLLEKMSTALLAVRLAPLHYRDFNTNPAKEIIQCIDTSVSVCPERPNLVVREPLTMEWSTSFQPRIHQVWSLRPIY